MLSMTPEELGIMRDEIRKAVKETVNGKIDALDKKLSTHMEEVAPYLKAGEALTFGSGIVKWIMGSLIAIGTLALLIKQVFLQS